MKNELWKKDKRLEITCCNKKDGTMLVLYYQLLDINIVDRWISLIHENKIRDHYLKFNYRKILNQTEIEEQFLEFQKNIEYINLNYTTKLPDIISVEHLRTHPELLNELHEEFEIYGDRIHDLIDSGYFNNPIEDPRYNEKWPGRVQNRILHEAFLTLNEQIHNFETIYRTWDNSHKSVCTCLIDFMPAGLHEPLTPEDYLLFTPEHAWGWLYLGYNTLGKHWSSACHDDDVDVVRRNQIRPQARFATEMYMNFKNLGPSLTRIELHKWWVDNNFSEFKSPKLLLEELALGFIPLARLIGYRLNNGNWIDAVSISDYTKWNVEIWSSCNSIESVNIRNLDE
jgi:hypothetical protein